MGMMLAKVYQALGKLKPRDCLVLELRFGFDHRGPRTLEEVGEVLHLSRSRVHEIEARALRRLRHPKISRELKLDIDVLPDRSPESKLYAAVFGLAVPPKPEKVKEGKMGREEFEKALGSEIKEEDRNMITNASPITDLKLDMRAINCLRRAGIDTVGQLRMTTQKELLSLRNLGDATLRRILVAVPKSEKLKVEVCQHIDAVIERELERGVVVRVSLTNGEISNIEWKHSGSVFQGSQFNFKEGLGYQLIVFALKHEGLWAEFIKAIKDVVEQERLLTKGSDVAE